MIDAGSALGLELGTRVVAYEHRDVILYALATGAQADELELVFERELRVLPTYGLVHSLWGAEELRERGFWDSSSAVHGAQRLEVLAPLPPRGSIEMAGRVVGVWDKGTAAVYDVEITCRYFRATSSIFAPGRGGWGGQRGPSTPRDPETRPSGRAKAATFFNQAALYRLTGDRHLIHIDPQAAEMLGQPRPILHGLCTLAVAVRALAALAGTHPCELIECSARFSAPVLPGETIDLQTWPAAAGEGWRFAASTERARVLSGGYIEFATAPARSSGADADDGFLTQRRAQGVEAR